MRNANSRIRVLAAACLALAMVGLMGNAIRVTNRSGLRTPVWPHAAVTWSDITDVWADAAAGTAVVNFTTAGVPVTAREVDVKLVKNAANTSFQLYCRPFGSTTGQTDVTLMTFVNNTGISAFKIKVPVAEGKADCWGSVSGVSATTYAAYVEGYTE